MTKLIRWFLVTMLAISGVFGVSGLAFAQDDDDDAANTANDSDIEDDREQTGRSASGDAVAGQVAGVVSAGDTSVDATNRSEDVDIETGDANGTNVSRGFTGQNAPDDGDADGAIVCVPQDQGKGKGKGKGKGGQDGATGFDCHPVGGPGGAFIAGGDGDGDLDNLADDGEIERSLEQNATAESGDGVGGQVIGVVTAAGGSADLVLANTSEDVDVETGDGDFVNDDIGFIGQNTGDPDFLFGGPEVDDDDDVDEEDGRVSPAEVLACLSLGTEDLREECLEDLFGLPADSIELQ